MKKAGILITGAFCLASFPLLALPLPSPLAQTAQLAEPLPETDFSKSNLSSEVMYKILSAELALSRNEVEVALENYIAVAKETQDPAVAQRATQIALSTSDLATALIPAQIWAEQDKENLESQITILAIEIRLGHPDKAPPYIEQIMKLDPIDGDRQLVMLFKQLPEDGDKAHVLAAYQAALKQNPKALGVLIALADIAISSEKPDDALNYTEKALTLKAQDPKAVILHAQALYEKNDIAKASRFLLQKLKEMPDNIPLNEYYVQFLLEQNQTDAAKVQMNKLAQFKTIQAEELLQMARISMQAGWFDIAETFLQKASQDAQQKDTAYYFLARLYEAKKDLGNAIAWYEKVMDGPFHVVAYIRASALLTELKEYDKASSILTKVEPQTVTDLKRISLARIDVYTKAQQYQKAFDLLNTFLQEAPDDMDFLYSRALVCEKLNKLPQMEGDFKKIIELDPKNVDAMNALGFLLADRTDRYQEALKYIQDALKISPENPSILDSLGWVQFKMGKKQEAIETLKKAFNLFPDPEIAAHLGEVLWSANQHNEATKVWNAALETYPNDEKILQTMQRFVGESRNNR